MRGCMVGDLSFGKFNVTLKCFCGWPVGTLVDNMRGNRDVMATENGARWHAGKSWRYPPQTCPFPWGDWIPIYCVVTWVHIYSICSNRLHLVSAAIWPNNNTEYTVYIWLFPFSLTMENENWNMNIHYSFPPKCYAANGKLAEMPRWYDKIIKLSLSVLIAWNSDWCFM